MEIAQLFLEACSVHCLSLLCQRPQFKSIMLFYSTGLKYFYIFHMFSFMAQYSYILIFYIQFSSVQLLRHVWLFVTPWAAARQASLSITNSQSLLKFMSIESVMPSNYLILCHPLSSCLQSFPASGSFQMSQFFASGGQSIGGSA